MSLIKLAESLYLKWARFISEAKEKKSEAPKSAPFGEFAWTKHREGFSDHEPETELEKQTYSDIKKHFASKHIGLPRFTVRLLMKCLQNGWYEKVLHPPPHKALYRGLKLSRVELAKLVDMNESELDDKKSISWNKPVKMTNGFSSSWTFRKTISKDFSGDYGKAKRGFAITLIADTSDNPNRFLAGPGGLYDVDGLSRWHLEKETVGLEPIVVRRIEWISIGND